MNGPSWERMFQGIVLRHRGFGLRLFSPCFALLFERMFIFSMILFSRLLVSQFLLPAVSSPQTENTRSFYVCLRCRSWQQVLGKWSQQWVFIGIRDRELTSTVFWVVLVVSKISNRFSVHSVWHSERCSRRMFYHVLCQEPETLQWWLAASWLAHNYRNLYTVGGLFIENLL